MTHAQALIAAKVDYAHAKARMDAADDACEELDELDKVSDELDAEYSAALTGLVDAETALLEVAERALCNHADFAQSVLAWDAALGRGRRASASARHQMVALLLKLNPATV